MMASFSFLLINMFLVAAEDFSFSDNEYCDAFIKNCDEDNIHDKNLIFYDVNPPEGFNLRRDVYMRFAIMLAEAKKSSNHNNWQLVLPPWHNLYHWKSETYESSPIFWGSFFDIKALKEYAPVLELYELFDIKSVKLLEIDTLYVLQNFEDPFAGGTFVDKWTINTQERCIYEGSFWGYTNITARKTVCVKFQGKISMLWEILSLQKSDKKVMFAHGEIPLHDTYGTKPYWDCRKSMKFNEKLLVRANEYILKNFECNTNKCLNYISIHWRRQDFARGRKKLVPSINGTVHQIDKTIKTKFPNIHNIFIASDASITELEILLSKLKGLDYQVYFYKPEKTELEKYMDGGVAIIDQIICSRAMYFIGTYESTFSFRIQEEREIWGFDSSTTFNCFCPDLGRCERPSKWTIVH